MKPAAIDRDLVPVGGTTGLCHASSSAIDEAASWYASHGETAERPLVPALRRRFGLTAREACQALAEGGRRIAGSGR